MKNLIIRQVIQILYKSPHLLRVFLNLFIVNFNLKDDMEYYTIVLILHFPLTQFFLAILENNYHVSILECHDVTIIREHVSMHIVYLISLIKIEHNINNSSPLSEIYVLDHLTNPIMSSVKST